MADLDLDLCVCLPDWGAFRRLIRQECVQHDGYQEESKCSGFHAD